MGTPREACYRCGAPVSPMDAYCDFCERLVRLRGEALDYCPMDDPDV